jgi:polar amino acid transport system substrate-binding protein
VSHGCELTAGSLEAFATNKATLFEISDEPPGSGVLPGRFGLERFAIGIPRRYAKQRCPS